MLSSERIAISQGSLLMIKAMSLPPEAKSGIIDLHTKSFNGFQYGMPTKEAKEITVELFPEGGHIDLIFVSKQNGAVPITQADINRTVQSLHRNP